MRSRSPAKTLLPLTVLSLAFLVGLYFASDRATGQPGPKPIPAQKPAHNARVQADNPLEAGKYIVLLGACNDCHTPGWWDKGIETPESEWLVGNPIGWKGPWGTNYASNLRRYVKAFTEDDFVAEMRTRDAAPPMPWASMHAMPEQDLRAMYKYIKSLKPLGKQTPASVGPDEDPKTPYYVMDPVTPKASPATKPAQ